MGAHMHHTSQTVFRTNGLDLGHGAGSWRIKGAANAGGYPLISSSALVGAGLVAGWLLALLTAQSSMQLATNLPAPLSGGGMPLRAVGAAAGAGSAWCEEAFPFPAQTFEERSGEGFRVYRPLDMFPSLRQTPPLLAHPEDWVQELLRKLEWLHSFNPAEGDTRPLLDWAKAAYAQVMESYASGVIFGNEERSVIPALQVPQCKVTPLNASMRGMGQDWTYLGDTMTGTARLENVRLLVEDVVKNNISGGYMETGVWRGGSSILARALLRSHGEGHRPSYVCDSFSGLPPGDAHLLDKGDASWDRSPYLEVADEVVATAFRRAGVLDPNVIFCKGFFNVTMPALADTVDELAIIRFDGDLYRSAVDVLYHAYEKLSIGGYFIVDDWRKFPSRRACEDFFAVHGHTPQVVPIDATAVYWKKTEEIQVQKWRYEKSDFKMH